MPLPPAKPPKPMLVGRLVCAEHTYVANEEDELSFEQGELLYVLDSSKIVFRMKYKIIVSLARFKKFLE